MEPGSPSRRRRRRIVVAGILAAGWIAALAVYLAVPPAEENPDVYDMQHSRMYDRQVEIIGGKAALLATQLDAWLASLWEGKARAYTIACATAAVALAYYAIDRALESTARAEG